MAMALWLWRPLAVAGHEEEIIVMNGHAVVTNKHAVECHICREGDILTRVMRC